MSEIVLRTGPLTSFKSLNYHLAPQLKQLRNLYAHGATPTVCWDMRDIVGRRILNVSTLTAFLSVAKRVSDFAGGPIPVRINWDPYTLGFLADIEFLYISKKLQILEWPEELMGGFQRGTINPNTKIIYFEDVPANRPESIEEINYLKTNLKQKISSNFLLRVGNVFEGIDSRLKWTVSNTTLELIANSLIHGLSTCFVCIQRTRPRITVAVCDSGIGFARSLRKFFYKGETDISSIQALIIGSLMQKKEHGLRLAIGEVLDYNMYLPDDVNRGWVIISSYDAEVRWQKANWHTAKYIFDNEFIPDKSYVIDVPKLLGDKKSKFAFKEDSIEGSWTEFPDFLIGTRVSFEILIQGR